VYKKIHKPVPWKLFLRANAGSEYKFDLKIILKMEPALDRLCGLVVRVLGYRSGGPGSIPGTTRFSEKKRKERKQ
jgi:hypothetical protein